MKRLWSNRRGGSAFRTTLKSYTVHVKKGAPDAYEFPEFVEEGFSWLAFLFAPFWALYHRLWVLAAILIAINLVADRAIAEGIAAVPVVIGQLALGAIIGFCADDLRRKSLSRRGYALADIVVGESLAQAQLRFFEHAFAGRNPPSHVGAAS